MLAFTFASQDLHHSPQMWTQATPGNNLQKRDEELLAPMVMLNT
jgi:hypothetical protein